MSDTTPERKFLTAKQVDNLGHALLALTREVAVLSDRVQTLEAVLESQDIPVIAAIENFAADESQHATQMERHQRLIASVLGALGVGVSPGEQMALASLAAAKDSAPAD